MWTIKLIQGILIKQGFKQKNWGWTFVKMEIFGIGFETMTKP
jgi:hypothetical protein